MDILILNIGNTFFKQTQGDFLENTELGKSKHPLNKTCLGAVIWCKMIDKT